MLPFRKWELTQELPIIRTGARRSSTVLHAFSAVNTSSSIFFASPNSIRLFSL